MTEVGWLRSDKPWAMRQALGPRCSLRKQQLFACAACRRTAPRFRNSEHVIAFINAIESRSNDPAESHDVEGLHGIMLLEIGLKWSSPGDPDSASAAVIHGLWPILNLQQIIQGCMEGAVAEATNRALEHSSDARSYLLFKRGHNLTPLELHDIRKSSELSERIELCHLFRDIFGNPFRSVSFSPEWRTSTAVAIAKGMYDSRDFGPMPLLADALQDAGCDVPEIIDHCRGPGPHVRGCWVVDGVLGKA